MTSVSRRRLLPVVITALLLGIGSFAYLLSISSRHGHRGLAVHDIAPPRHSALPTDVPIPRQIWQIFFPLPGAATLKDITFFASDWVSMAPGYTYTLVSDSEAASFISTSFSHRPEIGSTFHALNNPALKSDLLRYLILSARGGTYSDMDTKPVVPLEQWLPTALRRSTRVIVAIEYDSTQDGYSDQTAYPVQFCQWTIAAAPDHPLLVNIVDRAVSDLRGLAESGGTDLAETVFSDMDVLNTTGPVAWSESVMELLMERDASLTGWLDLTGLKEPRVFGDIVVLPVASFRADWKEDWGGWLDFRTGRRALVRHFFKGSWRAAKSPG
jgi:alpha 1,6-mannosyltransferase